VPPVAHVPVSFISLTLDNLSIDGASSIQLRRHRKASRHLINSARDGCFAFERKDNPMHLISERPVQRCGKPVGTAVVELHPRLPDIALYNCMRSVRPSQDENHIAPAEQTAE
jgi:hypothetical protein